MPDVPDREDLERKWAAAIGKLNRRQLRQLLDQLGDPPNVDNLPAEFWQNAGIEMQETIQPMAERLYLESAERIVNVSPIGVDWSLVNQAAIQWADRYSFELVTGINNTSRQAVSQTVSSFFREDLTMGELRQRLGSIYGPVRADMIAQTEVTRASVEGEMATAREIENQGIRMQKVWVTNRDEIVCPICQPLNNVRANTPGVDAVFVHPESGVTYDAPPAHPRCRCWINTEFTSE